MCDHAAYEELRADVDALKQDQIDLKQNQAVHCAASDEKFKTIFGFLKWIISFLLSITLILLLTVVYGAIGKEGMYAVSHEMKTITSIPSEK